ncbi:MAG: LEA type 2 family protein [Bacteroidia bacterium]|nr:LEA type 2 family protein [Bacteroidia bacterium]
MKNIKQLSAIILTATMLSSCAVHEIELVRVENFKVKSFNTKGAIVEVKARIKNPNSFGFKVKGSDLNLLVGNNQISNITLKDKIKIKRNTEQTYTFILQSDLAQILGGGLLGTLGMMSQGNFNVKIKGDIKAGNLFYTKRIPIDIDEKISPSSLLGL